MKKILRYFSIFLISAFLLSIFNYNSVSANFDASKNYVSISTDRVTEGEKEKVQLHITVTYQRGFATGSNSNPEGNNVPYAAYKICEYDESQPISSPNQCTGTQYDWKPFVTDNEKYISQEPASTADSSLTSKTFKVTTDIELDYSTVEIHYIVFVQTFFCAVRKVEEVGGGYSACQYWHTVGTTPETDQFTSLVFKLGDVGSNNITQIKDKDLNQAMQKIVKIVNDTVLPIIYIALGLFLVVKGSILGVQIVKSADEPQIRQEKIGSLKWLVIGVAIAYAASGIVHFVTAYFKSAFNFE